MSWGLNAERMAKCLSLNVPFKKGLKVNNIGIGLKNSIFPDGIRPMIGRKEPFGLHVYFHKRDQFIRSFASRKVFWPERKTNKSIAIIAYISGIYVLKRRYKPEFPCSDESEYDSWMLENLTRSIGCRPPYWSQLQGVPVCQNHDDLRNIASNFRETLIWNVDSNPPCTEIKKIQVDFSESDYRIEKDTMELSMAFTDLTFTEIKQSQAYDVKQLIGDVGGYIGLLLGYALLGMPGFLRKMYELLKMDRATNTSCSVEDISGNHPDIQVQKISELTADENKLGGNDET